MAYEIVNILSSFLLLLCSRLIVFMRFFQLPARAQQEDDPQQGDQQLGDRDCQPNAVQAEEIGKQEQHRKNDGDAP